MTMPFHPQPKGQTRRQEKLAKLSAERKVDAAARTIAWRRCEGKCETCERRITRSGDLLYGAHFHHQVYRSLGGRRNPQYRVLCAECHRRVHGRIR